MVAFLTFSLIVFGFLFSGFAYLTKDSAPLVIAWFLWGVVGFGCYRQRKTTALLRKVDTIVNTHMRALTRKRSQTLINDDYGNIIDVGWDKEIGYFIGKVVEPAIGRPIDMRLYSKIFARINDLVAAATLPSDSGFNDSMTGVEFEHYCAQLLRRAGWTASVTKASGDQGVDVIATKAGARLVVQCKMLSRPVGNKAVQEAAAARAHESADFAAVITNSKYTLAARKLASTNRVILIHHSEIKEIDDYLVKFAADAL